jgi:hypothetical protein
MVRDIKQKGVKQMGIKQRPTWTQVYILNVHITDFHRKRSTCACHKDIWWVGV